MLSRSSHLFGGILSGVLLVVACQVHGQTPSQQTPANSTPSPDASKQKEQVAPGVTGTRPPTDQIYAVEPAGTKGYTNYLENLQVSPIYLSSQDQVLSDPSSPYELVIPPTDRNYRSLSYLTNLTAEIMHWGTFQVGVRSRKKSRSDKRLPTTLKCGCVEATQPQ